MITDFNQRRMTNHTVYRTAMADVFVDRVTVYDKWCMEITWKCEDLVEKALDKAVEVEEMVG